MKYSDVSISSNFNKPAQTRYYTSPTNPHLLTFTLYFLCKLLLCLTYHSIATPQMEIVVPQITRLAANCDIGIEMFDILSNMLDPWTISTPKEAAFRINALYLSHQNQITSTEKKKATGTFLFQFWHLVFKIALQLPHDGIQQYYLLNLVEAIR